MPVVAYPQRTRLGNEFCPDGRQPGQNPHGLFVVNPNNGLQTVEGWFNTSAFERLDLSTTPAGVYGNAGRNIVQGPGLGQRDFSTFNNIRLTESNCLQFRAEFFNLFNRANFRLPNGDISSSTFGRIQQALPSRLVQFALKFLF